MHIYHYTIVLKNENWILPLNIAIITQYKSAYSMIPFPCTKYFAWLSLALKTTEEEKYWKYLLPINYFNINTGSVCMCCHFRTHKITTITENWKTISYLYQQQRVTYASSNKVSLGFGLRVGQKNKIIHNLFACQIDILNENSNKFLILAIKRNLLISDPSIPSFWKRHVNKSIV
jgi:hypothetical protein